MPFTVRRKGTEQVLIALSVVPNGFGGASVVVVSPGGGVALLDVQEIEIFRPAGDWPLLGHRYWTADPEMLPL